MCQRCGWQAKLHGRYKRHPAFLVLPESSHNYRVVRSLEYPIVLIVVT